MNPALFPTSVKTSEVLFKCDYVAVNRSLRVSIKYHVIELSPFFKLKGKDTAIFTCQYVYVCSKKDTSPSLIFNLGLIKYTISEYKIN